MRRAVATALLGARRLARLVGRGAGDVVLCYHRVVATQAAEEAFHDPELVVPRDDLARQLDALLEDHTLAPLAALDGRAPRATAGPQVAVTFDDGYADLVPLALPVVAERGGVATLFQTGTPTVDRPLWFDAAAYAEGTSAADAGYIELDGLHALRAAGWEIAGHTATHATLPEADPAAVRDEVVRNRHALGEVLGAPPDAFAYPGGFFDETAIAAVRDAGYAVAYTVDGALRRFPGTGAELTLDRRAVSGRSGRDEHGRFSAGVFRARALGLFDALRRLRG